jgi:hypothetical protein
MAEPEVLWRFDASTDWGMDAVMWVIGEPTAVFVMHKWTAVDRRHAFVDKRESTGVMEGMAAVRCASAFAKRSRGKRVLMEGDNEALARGLNRGYSSTPKMMKPIITVGEVVAEAGVHLRSTHIIGTCTLTCTPRLQSRTCARMTRTLTIVAIRATRVSPARAAVQCSRCMCCAQVTSSTALLITSPTIGYGRHAHAQGESWA